MVLASGDMETRKVANLVRNEDLLQLRADCLRRVVGTELLSLSGSDAIEILHDVPAAGQGRTAEVIVFVKR